MSLFSWLGLADDPDHPQVDSLGEIEKALENLDPSEARYIACFAYILHRIARADHQISEDESRLIERLVSERGGLPPDRAAARRIGAPALDRPCRTSWHSERGRIKLFAR